MASLVFPRRLTSDEAEELGPFGDIDTDLVVLGTIAQRPREYLGELPVYEVLLDPADATGRAGHWPGDRYLGTDDDGELIEVVVVRHGTWERAAENGMGA